MPTMNSTHSAHASPAGYHRGHAFRAIGVTGTASVGHNLSWRCTSFNVVRSRASMAGSRLGSVTDGGAASGI
jgi:hypothetical protein